MMYDGYYLSAYIVIGELAHLLNLEHRHDQNISLWQKTGDSIELIHYWELERISGEKHHSTAFYNVEQAKSTINGLLVQYGLTINDMREIWGCPGLETNHEYIQKYDFPLHSLAHLMSGLLCDTSIFQEESILTLAVDGGPDNVVECGRKYKKQYVGCYSSSGSIRELFAVESPALLWEEAKNLFCMPEGSLMALAFSNPCRLVEHILPEFTIWNMQATDAIRAYVNKLYAHITEAVDSDMGISFMDSRFSKNENIISAAIKEIDYVSKQIMRRNIDKAISLFNIDPSNTYLSITGGFGLNCPINSYLIREYGFRGYIAPPCVNDSGISLGIGLLNFHSMLPRFTFCLKTAFYGDTCEQDDDHMKLYDVYIESKDENPSLDRIVEDIISGPIVWVNGKAEIGPRALGHRSILGDPRELETKNRLNKIKQREWWRPVAPIVLQPYIKEWFEDAFPSPFMLHVFTIKKAKRKLIPAVAHLDYSARVQTLSENTDSFLYSVVAAFHKKTGIPMLCNTSLNDKNEPIINSVDEVFNFAIRKKLQIVYINGTRYVLRNNADLNTNKPASRPLKMSIIAEPHKQMLLSHYNPHELSNKEIDFYFDYHLAEHGLSIQEKTDAVIIKSLLKKVEMRESNG